MPKIIPDLSSRILVSAAEHFQAQGYVATDMKSLATHLGISVGTLYNYYPSKPELFLAVCASWRKALLDQVVLRVATDDSPLEKLRWTLVHLYENITAYTGLWHEFTNSGGKGRPDSPMNRRCRDENQELYGRLQALFQEVWVDRPHARPILHDPQNRLAQLAVTSLMQLVLHGGPEAEDNHQFILAWIDFLASPHRNGL